MEFYLSIYIVDSKLTTDASRRETRSPMKQSSQPATPDVPKPDWLSVALAVP